MGKRPTLAEQQAAQMSPVVAKLHGAYSMNEYPLTEEETEFINALNVYKEKTGRRFPTWSEVLHVLKSLGYRKEGR